jgi:hypothetical protein
MPRHRALPSRSRAFATVAASGAALSAWLFIPATATAAPLATNAHDWSSRHAHDRHGHTDHTSTRTHGGTHTARRTTTHHRRLRPMSSGEQQYRNGCLQGYITDDCEQFSVHGLTHKGINPFL